MPKGPRGDAPQTRKADQRTASAYTSTPAYKQALVQVGAHRYGLKYDPKAGAYVRKVKSSLLGIDSLRKDSNVAFNPVTGKPLGLGNKRDAQVVQRVADKQFAASPVNAGVLKILNETTRLARVQPSILRAALHGKNPASAGGSAFLHNKGPLYGQVFHEDLGIPKVVAGVLGFTADVASDPTTFSTFGATSVAKHLATAEAERAGAKAAAAGLSKSAQETVARGAYKRALKSAPKGKGVTFKFAGQQVPKVTEATAAVHRGISAVADRAPQRVKDAAGGVHGVARDFRPMLKPSGVDQQAFTDLRRAGRIARSGVARDITKGDATARQLQKALAPGDYKLVVDALERGKIGSLPEHLRSAAIRLRSDYRYAKRQRARAGIPEGTVGGKTRGTLVHPEPGTRNVYGQRFDVSATQKSLIRRAGLNGKAPVVHELRQVQRQIVEAQRGGVATKVDALVKRRDALVKQIGLPDLNKIAQDPATVVRRGRLTATTVRPPRGPVKGYYPRVPEDIIDPSKAADHPSVIRGTKTRPTSSKSRGKGTQGQTIAQVNVDRVMAGDAPHSLNVPLVHAQYLHDTAKAVHAAHLNRAVLKVGHVLKPGDKAWPRKGEAVFHIKGDRITDVKVKHGNRWVYDEKAQKDGGQYVVADKGLVNDTVQSVVHAADRTKTGMVFDRASGGWKRIATFSPAFHARNAVGDTQMGYLGQSGLKLPGNMARAARGVNRMSKLERDASGRLVGAPEASKQTINVAGKPQPLDEFVREAERQGVPGAGFIGRELNDLHGSDAKDVRVRNRRIPVAVKQREAARQAGSKTARTASRWGRNREAWARLATYKSGLDRGMSSSEAADLAAHFHIDYGDLSRLERTVLRRVFPFYTFSARAIPIHAKALVQTPGKFATIEKARQEAAYAAGLSSGWQGNLPEYQQRQAPIPVKVGGKTLSVNDSLPLNTLNELPTSANPGKYASEIAKLAAGLENPAVKIPHELLGNVSLFFRRPIQDPNHPLVSAPSWVANLPASARKQLGIVPDYVDKRSGRKVWGWPGRLDYIDKSIPGLTNQLQQLATAGANQRGQGTPEKALAFLTGIKADPYDPRSNDISKLINENAKLTERKNSIGQRAGGKATAEYQRLGARIRVNTVRITALSAQRGDKNVAGSQPASGGLAGQILKERQQALSQRSVSPLAEQILQERAKALGGK